LIATKRRWQFLFNKLHERVCIRGILNIRDGGPDRLACKMESMSPKQLLNCVRCTFLLALGIGTATLARGDDAHPAFSITNTFAIGGEGGWDYLVADPATHLLYVTRTTHLQVIDSATGTVTADLPNCGAHGVALVPRLGKGFTSDGKADTVTAFDLKTNAVLYTLPAGHNPDCIIYDSSSKKVLAFDGKSSDVTVIAPDARTPNLAVTGHIPLDGKPEFAASDTHGQVYVNIADKNEIQEISTRTMTVTSTWKIDAQSPSGLAIDIEHHHLFAGCDGKMAIVDTLTGKTLATPPIGDGVDACAYDPATGNAFASCGDGTLAVIRETSPGKFETVEAIKTKTSARTMALDPSTHTIYLPCGELLPKAEGERRPKIKPDSFSILVLSPVK
jgi:DNA-binding beta-propeller fold protein YncE